MRVYGRDEPSIRYCVLVACSIFYNSVVHYLFGHGLADKAFGFMYKGRLQVADTDAKTITTGHGLAGTGASTFSCKREKCPIVSGLPSETVGETH